VVTTRTLAYVQNSSNALVDYPMSWIVLQACITITNTTIVITQTM